MVLLTLCEDDVRLAFDIRVCQCRFEKKTSINNTKFAKRKCAITERAAIQDIYSQIYAIIKMQDTANQV